MRTQRLNELVIAAGFAGSSAVAHLIWRPIDEYWQFVVTAMLFVTGLSLWLINEWRGMQLFVTKFYCLVVIFDICAEGMLQPFRKCTSDNLICTGRMFLVFFTFWLILHPLERWFAGHRIRTADQSGEIHS